MSTSPLLHAIDRRGGKRATQFDLDSRERFLEHRQDRREHVGGIEVRRAQYDVAVNFRRGQPRQQLIVQPQNRFRISQHHVAVGSQLHPAPFVVEQGLAGDVLKPLNLQADSGLSPSEPACRFGDTAGVDDRNQRTKHPDIKTEKFIRSRSPHGPRSDLAYPMQASCKRNFKRAQILCSWPRLLGLRISSRRMPASGQSRRFV